jgi:hypothetical protein
MWSRYTDPHCQAQVKPLKPQAVTRRPFRVPCPTAGPLPTDCDSRQQVGTDEQCSGKRAR